LKTGTHLYVLYEGYGFSVASLYCLGFATGGLMSPITGPLVDRIGRKKSAILYCFLEIVINYLEQHPFLTGLIVSRMIGGFTTNLLSSVFETWLDTEYRKRGFQKEKYEIILRDSVIVSNSAAIFSGYLAHVLADRYGAVGPFQGAVSCTAVALIVVCFVWTENYGRVEKNNEPTSPKNVIGYFREAVAAFKEDHKMLRVGVLQGLTAGSIQIFVFLWAPTLRHFSRSAQEGAWGLDKEGEPAYGLIFGAYMGAGVLGGICAPHIRRLMTALLSRSPYSVGRVPIETVHNADQESSNAVRPMAVEALASACYFLSAVMLLVPCIVPEGSVISFSTSLAAFLIYELLIGVFLPCEGVIRSLYFPANARASIMTLPRVIFNVAVSLGVVSTNFVG
jgi:MFS family permease